MIKGRQVDRLQRPGGRGAGDRQLVADGEFLGGQIGDQRRDEVSGTPRIFAASATSVGSGR